MKIKQKKIDNQIYTFVTVVKYSDKNIMGRRLRNMDAKLTFSGNDINYKDRLTLKDFERKAGVKLPATVVIDSISFSVNEGRDDINLIYYLKNMVLPMKVTFEISYDDQEWILKK